MGGHGVPCPYVRTIFDVCILLCFQFVEGIMLTCHMPCEVIDRHISYGRGNPLWLPGQARGLPESFCIQWAGMACHAPM